jgi:hypothetical protein|tara:strand:- start:143 stop:406 length:264 start_codon:yes stop_codon:yes gene_type:complete
MVKKYIHVNQHKIRANKKNGTNDPVITIKEGRTNTYCHEVKVFGECTIKYGGNDKPILPCGARVVIETEGIVEIINPKNFVEATLNE